MPCPAVEFHREVRKQPRLRRIRSSEVGCRLMKPSSLAAVSSRPRSAAVDCACHEMRSFIAAVTRDRDSTALGEAASSNRRNAYSRSSASSLRLANLGGARQVPVTLQALDARQVALAEQKVEPAPLVLGHALQRGFARHLDVAIGRHVMVVEGHRAGVGEPHAAAELPLPMRTDSPRRSAAQNMVRSRQTAR